LYLLHTLRTNHCLNNRQFIRRSCFCSSASASVNHWYFLLGKGQKETPGARGRNSTGG